MHSNAQPVYLNSALQVDLALLGTSLLRHRATATGRLHDIDEERLERVEPRQRAVLTVQRDIDRVLGERNGLVAERDLVLACAHIHKPTVQFIKTGHLTHRVT